MSLKMRNFEVPNKKELNFYAQHESTKNLSEIGKFFRNNDAVTESLPDRQLYGFAIKPVPLIAFHI